MKLLQLLHMQDIVGRNDFYVHYNQLSEHFESLRLKVHELNRGLSELLHSKINSLLK